MAALSADTLQTEMKGFHLKGVRESRDPPDKRHALFREKVIDLAALTAFKVGMISCISVKPHSAIFNDHFQNRLSGSQKSQSIMDSCKGECGHGGAQFPENGLGLGMIFVGKQITIDSETLGGRRYPVRTEPCGGILHSIHPCLLVDLKTGEKILPGKEMVSYLPK